MLEDKLIALLGYGEKAAHTSKVLAWECDTSDREVRLAIRDMITDGLPIASSTHGVNGGYFYANTQEEAKAYLLEMRSRVIELCKRMRDFKYAARPLLFPGQLPLNLK